VLHAFTKDLATPRPPPVILPRAVEYLSAATPHPSSAYRPDVDGLRAIAVCSVVLFHCGFWPISSGFVGVDIFFVISGYLIGGIILRDTKAGRFRLGHFYARRARRILPALFVVVTAACASGWFLLSASEYRAVGATAVSTLLAYSNFSFWRFQDYFVNGARFWPLLMTWSLGVEEQFYLLLPFLVLALRRYAWSTLLTVLSAATLASFGLALYWTRATPMAAFYLLPGRAWEFGVGIILAALEMRFGPGWCLFSDRWRQKTLNALAWLGLLLLAIGVTGFDESTPFPGLMAVLPVLGAALLLAAQGSWVNQRLLSNKPIVFVGLISYSWYLWHWPFISYVRIIVPNTPPTWLLATFAAISFVIAVLSWRLVEIPFRRLRLSPRRVLRSYAFALAIALVLPMAIRLTGGFPERMDDDTKQLETLAADGRGEKCLAWLENKINFSGECVSVVATRPNVALIGDSHAAALAAGLRQLAAQQNLGYRIFAASSCPPLLNVTVSSKQFSALMDVCAAFVPRVLKEITADPSVEYVVLAAMWYAPLADYRYHYVDVRAPAATINGSELLRQGLQSTIDLLTAAGKKVVIVTDSPTWSFNPFRLELANSINLRKILAGLMCIDCPFFSKDEAGLRYVANVDYQNTIRDLRLETHDNVRFFDIWDKFCDSNRCEFNAASSSLLFFDTNHLSINGSRLVASAIKF
jgi:peptidoglycan/LPS O-acetylase OafA/YrhL